MCTFKRNFAAGEISGIREILWDDEIEWMAGYNIYKSKTSIWRYVYGYSYESNISNKLSALKAEAIM